MANQTLYQTSSDLYADQSIGMYYCGKRIKTENHVYGPEIRDHYLFLLVNEGTAELYRDGKPKYRLKKHDLLVMCPGERIYYKAKTTWSIRWLGLYGTAVDAFVRQLGISGDAPILEIGAYYEANELFEEVYRIASKKDACSDLKQLSLIYSFFSLLFREKGVRGQTDYITAAKKMIDFNLNLSLSVEDIAADLHLNPSYFTRIFSEQEGITPKQYILEQKIKRAKALLTGTGASVKEIANSVGFSDALYFSRLFRKKTGSSPGEYRTKDAN